MSGIVHPLPRRLGQRIQELRSPALVQVLNVVFFAVVVGAFVVAGAPLPSGWEAGIGLLGIAGYVIANAVKWQSPGSQVTHSPLEPPLVVALAVWPAPTVAAAAALAGLGWFAFEQRGVPNFRAQYGVALWTLSTLIAGTLAAVVGHWLAVPVVASLVLLALPLPLLHGGRWLAGAPADVWVLAWQMGIVAVVVGVGVSRAAMVDLPLAFGIALVTVVSIPGFQLLEGAAARSRRAEHAQRRLSLQVVDADDRARTELAEALHVGPLQELAAASLLLGQLDDGRAGRIQQIVESTAVSLREVARGYGAGAADVANHRVDGALRRNLPDAPVGTVVSVHVDDQVDALALPVSAQAYRIALEAATNAIRYAQASTVKVAVTVEHDRVVIDVRDDGVGFDIHDVTSHDRPHLGLALMAARTEGLGGTFHLHAAAGGTRVRASIPAANGTTAREADGNGP